LKRVLFALLFASLACAFSLGDYSHHLVEGEYDSSLLFLFPQPCDGFLTPIELPASIESNEAFEKAVEHALAAEEEFAYAAWFALLQKTARTMGVSGEGLNRYASFACFQHGARGLNAAVRSTKSGLDAVDSRLLELDAMLDSSFTGPASGFLSDLNEAKGFIEDWNSSTESFGSDFVSTVDSLDLARAGLSSLPTAPSIVIAANSLFSLLDSESGLYEEAGSAIDSMEEEYLLSLDSAESLEANLESTFKEVKSLKLESVQEDAFLSVGAGSKAATGYSVHSFEEDFTETRSLSAFASWSIDEAKRKWRLKDLGYASRAIMSLRNASSTLDACAALLDDYTSRGYWLETELRERVNEELAEAFELARSHDDPYAFTIALHETRSTLDEADRVVPVLGDRIDLFLRLLERASSIKRELSAWKRGGFDAKARLASNIERISSVFESAERDGLSIEWERNRLKEIKDASLELGSSERDASTALLLESDLLALEERVYASAAFEYAFELESYYSFLEPVAHLLSASRYQEFIQAARFFPNGFLDERGALGSLADLRGSLSKLAAHARLQAPNILRAHLSETSVVQIYAVEPFEIGEPVRVEVTVSLRNSLPVSYNGLLSLKVDGLPKGFSLQFNSTNSAFNSGESFFVEGIEQGSTIDFIATGSLVLARYAGESLEVAFASDSEARVTRTYLFESSLGGRVLLNASLHEKESVVSVRVDSGKAEWSLDGRAFALFDEGRHWFELDCVAVEPVNIERTITINAGTMAVDYYLTNDYLHLDSFEFNDFVDLSCEPSSFESTSDEGVTVVVEGGAQSFVRLLVSDFAFGEIVWARVSFDCDSIAEAAGVKFDALSLALNNSFEEELLEIKAHLQSGDYEKALSKAFDLEEELFKVELKASEASESNSFSSRVLAFSLGLSDESLKQALEAAAGLEGRDSVFKAVNEVAKARVAALKAECKECVGEANSFLAVGDPLKALESALEQEKSLREEAGTLEVESSRLESLLSEYSSVRSNALALLAEFESAFFVHDGESDSLEESKAYSDASRYKKSLESEMKALDKAVANPLKYASSIESDLNDYRIAFNALESALGNVRASAETELALAESQQARFGNSESQPLLLEAQAAFDDGSYYTSYLLANSLRHSLLEVSKGVSGEDSTWRLLLGAFGLLCLLALAFLFTRKRNKRSRQV
jgi:hypothetical protein